MKTATKFLLATTTSLCLLTTQSNASEEDFLLGLGLGVAGAIVADEAISDDVYVEEVYIEEVYINEPDLYVDDNGDIYVDDYDDFYEEDIYVDEIYVEDVYIEVPQVVIPQATPRHQPAQTQTRKPSQNQRKVGSPQTRGIQVRLNSLGYNAGKPDGIPGKNTRNAISRFQTSLNHPATGKLTNVEIAALVEKTSNLNSKKQPQKTDQSAKEARKKDPVKTAGKMPSIHGMTTGAPFAGTAENLTKKGYSNCQIKTGTVSCTRTTKSLKDQITVGSIDGSVYAIQRSVHFIEPVPRKEIEHRIASAYPNLINQNNMIQASSAHCLTNYQQSPSSLALSTLKTPREVQQLLAAAKSCSYLYAIEIDDKDPASRLDIVLYSAKPIQSALHKKTDIFGATTEKTKDLTF
ncbi:putative peptidoglycan binding domain protein [Pseudovibrio sp. W64]|uniref:peptidoglycan-binding domain-containing protein n=1 Tax=Pseudovibrio sp. W64 TaxID=1735583 RepID=UPI0007AE3A7D|nr:peptidoglycan-binding domain-containing protein [Pseudovibrio sp. W64]KZK76242.1 putative peptidoglycan binding domain protein [Pseudovibrio sp. W64]